MGIFDNQVNVFSTYRAKLVFRSRIMGGTPKNPQVVLGWIKSRMGIDEIEELRRKTISTLIEMGIDNVTQDMTIEELEKAGKELASTKQTNGFKIGEHGLYIEARHVKAMLKENTNIQFSGEKWLKLPKTSGEGEYGGKGPKNALAERVFVDPEHIWLGVTEPTGIELFIGHTTGPQGRQSNLTYYEYVERPTIEFEVKVNKDFMMPDQWAQLWVQAQENGLGSLRSQGFGRFDIEEWEEVRSFKARRVA